MLKTREIMNRLKEMGDVYREQGSIYDALSVRIFSDGSGRVLDGDDIEILEFTNLMELDHGTEQWLLDQIPDPTEDHYFDDLENDDIEVELASDIAELLSGNFKGTPSLPFIPFDGEKVEVQGSTVTVKLHGRMIYLNPTVRHDDEN